MITLYYSAGACSMGIHVVLNELGLEFDLVRAADDAGNKNPDFLKINPRGAVPAIKIDDLEMAEGAAILLHLTDTYPNNLMPKSGSARAKALQILMFANATLHPAYARMFGLRKSGLEGEVVDKLMQHCFDQINKLWAELDAELAKQPYLSGDQITLADILVTVIGNWGMSFAADRIKHGKNCKDLFKRVIERPSYQAAIKREQVEYQAAA